MDAPRIEPNDDPRVALRLEQAAGWPRGLDELARRWEAWPRGHLVARSAAGADLGVVSVASYGALAWLGGMVVHPDARRQGVGRALLDAAIRLAREQGATTIGLDATRDGRPLYERMGFRAVGETPRWRAEGPAPAPPSGDHTIYPISSCEVMDLARYDRPRFGANRVPWLAALMARFPERSFVAFHRGTGEISGYVLATERHVAPLVADDAVAAARLLHAARRAGAPPQLIATSANPAAEAMLRAAGFSPEGVVCARMLLGGDLPGRADAQWSIAGWSFG